MTWLVHPRLHVYSIPFPRLWRGKGTSKEDMDEERNITEAFPGLGQIHQGLARDQVRAEKEEDSNSKAQEGATDGSRGGMQKRRKGSEARRR